MQGVSTVLHLAHSQLTLKRSSILDMASTASRDEADAP